ncbi:ethanolamine utilization protein EutH [Pseudoramibacter sp. HA2172]|uniref:ethanolamine utilization protein EutH n=1 Tax=Pseudoramibacter faecis TaxID=3108534 RepID=UPI002E7A1B58|nr:ethanolamine utilization protein EutH [Pseudoramibacter sp. HA2172]
MLRYDEGVYSKALTILILEWRKSSCALLPRSFSVWVQVDYLPGNRFGIGESFCKEVNAIVELLFLMTGFIALASWIKAVPGSAIAPFFMRDPSLFAGMLLSDQH